MPFRTAKKEHKCSRSRLHNQAIIYNKLIVNHLTFKVLTL